MTAPRHRPARAVVLTREDMSQAERFTSNGMEEGSRALLRAIRAARKATGDTGAPA